MGFLKRNCRPERRKAIIAVHATLSPATLSAGATQGDGESAPLDFRTSLSIAELTRPDEAITICTDRSILTQAHPDDELDTFAQKTAGLASVSDSARRINLGQYIVGACWPSTPPSLDLKKRPLTCLLTIPAKDEVVRVQKSSLAPIFKYEGRLKLEDVVGETWHVELSESNKGTPWWL